MTNKIPSNSWQLAYNFFKNVFSCYLRISYIYSLCFSQIHSVIPPSWLLPELTHCISSQFSYMFFLNPLSPISALNMGMVLEPCADAVVTTLPCIVMHQNSWWFSWDMLMVYLFHLDIVCLSPVVNTIFLQRRDKHCLSSKQWPQKKIFSCFL